MLSFTRNQQLCDLRGLLRIYYYVLRYVPWVSEHNARKNCATAQGPIHGGIPDQYYVHDACLWLFSEQYKITAIS